MATPAEDLPRALSSLLVPPSLTPQGLYSTAHTSDITTAKSLKFEVLGYTSRTSPGGIGKGGPWGKQATNRETGARQAEAMRALSGENR
jgi:hypothetical protein